MAALEFYRQRFAESGWEVFTYAVEDARARGQNRVAEAHALGALLQKNAGNFSALLREVPDSRAAFDALARMIEERVASAPKHEGEGVALAPEVVELFKRASRLVRSQGRQKIEATDIYLLMLTDQKSLLIGLLRGLVSGPESKTKLVGEILAAVEVAGGHSRWRRFDYLAGETVRIKSGPFASFTGKVSDVDREGATLNVSVQIFGREQPVLLRFLDVEKVAPNE
ncbi:MAG TPA: KOW motif-containing protein [Pyrinomonadaceae bacterium]|jgi:transcription antitermination factor NusG